MKKLVSIFCLLFVINLNAQDSRLAYSYFRKGEFTKSVVLYEELYKKNERSVTYFNKLLRCYQELERYDEATLLIENKRKKQVKHAYILVELGYNYQLQNQKEKAVSFYKKAIKMVEKDPNLAYLAGRSFQENHLLDYALEVYKKAMLLKPALNFDIYIANLYGEKGEVGLMFEAYLDMLAKKPNYLKNLQRYIGNFITDDALNNTNILFRRSILKRLQNNPNVVWNQLLSWLYMKQKEYSKALIQEKAVYKHSQENINVLFELATTSSQDKDYVSAMKTYLFIISNAHNTMDVIHAKNQLLLVETTIANNEEDYIKIEKQYKALLKEYGNTSSTIETQINYAGFLVFSKGKLEEAISVLTKAKEVATSKYQLGKIKMKLADIFVFENKFNRALITYTQVQTDLKGSEIAQNARLKVATTSYYKGDFDWAKTQLKVLKSATSKLIANDALKLNLLISDNIAGDTIRIALKKYAFAELLAYQKKPKQAIDTLAVILNNYKGHAIEDEALLQQAILYEGLGKFELAKNNYLKIIQLKNSILLDDAYYALGELYKNKLKKSEKAKEMYQKIIFEHPNSIFVVSARKKFRKLRGDQLNL